MTTRRARYLRHRFPPEIISYAAWVYHRYCLSFLDVEDLLTERGILVSYETVRQWCQRFGPDYTRHLKRRQGRLGDTWFLDEVFVTINGQRQYLWRAVDQDGNMIDILVQPRRDGCAARRFFRRLLKSQRQEPCRLSGHHTLRRARHSPIREQSCGGLASTDPTTGASDARLPITRPRAALPVRSRRHSESVSRGSPPPKIGASSNAKIPIVRCVGFSNSGLTLWPSWSRPGSNSLS
jgi:hypothetical protein